MRRRRPIEKSITAADLRVGDVIVSASARGASRRTEVGRIEVVTAGFNPPAVIAVEAGNLDRRLFYRANSSVTVERL